MLLINVPQLECINSFPNKPVFCTSLDRKWKPAFSPFSTLFSTLLNINLSHTEIVICKCFQFGQGLNAFAD